MRPTAFTEWETPQDFYDAIDAEFHFNIDVCCLPSNKKCDQYYYPMMNALNQTWKGVCWMNPPYDREIGLWMAKAYESAQQGATVACLIQGRSSDTKWWHKYVMRSSEIRYIADRLHFGKNGVHSRANISNILVIFRPFCEGPPTTSSIDASGRKLRG